MLQVFSLWSSLRALCRSYTSQTNINFSDDYWPYQVLRMCTYAPQLAAFTKPVKGKTQHSMHVLGINDLEPHESCYALRNMRKAVTRHVEESDEKLRHIVRMIGGRLSFLSRVARAPNMEESAKVIVKHEKAWLQSQIGLIPDHDDDVMDDVRVPNRLQTVAIPLTHVHSAAKMVVMLLATAARVCQDAAGGRKGV